MATDQIVEFGRDAPVEVPAEKVNLDGGYAFFDEAHKW
jgi:hypothetical protein